MISWYWLIPAVQAGVVIGVALIALLQMSKTTNEGDEPGVHMTKAHHEAPSA